MQLYAVCAFFLHENALGEKKNARHSPRKKQYRRYHLRKTITLRRHKHNILLPSTYTLIKVTIVYHRTLSLDSA